MRKKLTALITAVCMISASVGLISSSAAEQFSDISENKHSVAINTVCGLGIMEEADYGLFFPDNTVTRGEAAMAVGKLMKYDWYLDGETTFVDVPAGVEETVYINTLKSMEIMVGYSDEYFGYNDVVTAEQFETILLRATGYMGLKDLMSKSEMLVKADFLDNVELSGTDSLTRAVMAQLLYNCLETEEISIDYKGTYSADGTVLENRHGLKKIMGTVTANSRTRLSSTGGAGVLGIEIDSVKYSTSYAQADELLGYPVVAYCEIDTDDIKYMHINSSRCTVIEVPDYDIEDITTDGANVTVKYEYDSKMEVETFGINDNILYNGTAISELTNSSVAINMGGIKIVELNSGVRNVFIESYTNYVVQYVNTDSNTFVDKLTRKTISLDFDDDIKFYKFGYETAFDQINAGDVISVYDNNNKQSRYITVYISNDTETGKVTGCDGEFVYINGKTYRVAKGVDLTEYIGRFAGPFYIDVNGRVVGADEANNTGMKYGCLVKIMYDEALVYSAGGDKDFLTFKILESSGQIIDYPASDKLRINEQNVYKDWENFPFDLFKKNGAYVNQLIKYQVNYEGKITSIYTENTDFEDSPQAKTGYFAYRYRRNSGGMFYGDTMISQTSPGFFINSSTLIFAVPSAYTGNPADYKVMSPSSFLEMEVYESKPYDVNEYSVAKALMVTSAERVTDSAALFGVNKVLSMANSDDEIVQGIEGVSSKSVAKYELRPNVTTQVKKGDIMQINVDESGKVNAVNVIVNAESMGDIIPKDDFHNDFAVGTLFGVDGDYLRLDFANKTSLSLKLTNNTRYYVYKKDKQIFEVADKNSLTMGKKVCVLVLTGYAGDVILIED